MTDIPSTVGLHHALKTTQHTPDRSPSPQKRTSPRARNKKSPELQLWHFWQNSQQDHNGKNKNVPTTCHFTLQAPLEDKGLGQCRWCLGGWWPTAGFLPTGTAHPGAQAPHKYWGEQRSSLLQTALSRGMVCAAMGLCGGDVAELCTGHVAIYCIVASWSQ